MDSVDDADGRKEKHRRKSLFNQKNMEEAVDRTPWRI